MSPPHSPLLLPLEASGVWRSFRLKPSKYQCLNPLRVCQHIRRRGKSVIPSPTLFSDDLVVHFLLDFPISSIIFVQFLKILFPHNIELYIMWPFLTPAAGQARTGGHFTNISCHKRKVATCWILLFGGYTAGWPVVLYL